MLKRVIKEIKKSVILGLKSKRQKARNFYLRVLRYLGGSQDESVKSNNYFHYDEVTIEKLEILDDKLISLEQKMKEIREMNKQILQFKDDVVNDRC